MLQNKLYVLHVTDTCNSDNFDYDNYNYRHCEKYGKLSGNQKIAVSLYEETMGELNKQLQDLLQQSYLLSLPTLFVKYLHFVL